MKIDSADQGSTVSSMHSGVPEGAQGKNPMSIAGRSRKAVKKLLFGNTLFPQKFFLGQPEPQTEVAVWLHGMDEPIDVTRRHSMACAVPLTICIAFEEGQRPTAHQLNRLSLRFCERDGEQRLIGEIGLRFTSVIFMKNSKLSLFEARSATNHCLPKSKLWMHSLFHSYTQWRNGGDSPDIKMSSVDKRALAVMFFCPRPVSLVSAVDENGGNIFPVNVMGDLDNGYFAFGLKDSRLPAHLVERSGRIALSNVPLPQASIAYRLGVNHTKKFVDWYKLPFETTPSTTFKIPVPVFALRVREMQVESVHRIGSHTLFIARIVSDERIAHGVEMYVVHGFYQAWRVRNRRVELSRSVAEDSLVKFGQPPDRLPS